MIPVYATPPRGLNRTQVSWLVWGCLALAALLVAPLSAEAQLRATLIAPGAAEGDLFGYDVAVDGDTAAIGAPFASVGPNAKQGAVHVFVRTNGVWVPQARLVLPNGLAGDGFGAYIALSGNSLLVGHPSARVNGVGGGAAYVFSRSGATWSGPEILVGLDRQNNHFFGEAVALDGSTAIVGAAGATAAYVFVKSGGGWVQQAKLTSPLQFVGFGRAVAVHGDTAVIGADQEDYGSNTLQGSAYVFRRSGTSWSTSARRITGTDATANSRFGTDVAVHGDTILVGATRAAYVFAGANVVEQAKLTSTEAQSFGFSLGIRGDRAIIGAQFRNPAFAANTQGAAYLFARSGMGWTQTARLTQLPPTANPDAGYFVAFDGETALLGSYRYRNGTGAAFVYSVGAAMEAPSNLTTLVNRTNVRFSWTAPAQAVASYVLEAGFSSGATSIPPIDLGAQTFVEFQGIPNGLYYARVRARMTDGALSGPSNEVVVAVPGFCRRAAPPATFTATAIGGVATLTWDPVPGATQYVIEAGTASEASDLLIAVDPSSTRFSAVAPAGLYFLRVRAVTFCGPTSPSQERRLRVGGAGPLSITVDDMATTRSDLEVVIPVLANDLTSLGGRLTVVSVVQPANGMADANPDGTITYEAADGFVGRDEFTYTVEDELGGFATGTVVVDVASPIEASDGMAADSRPISYQIGNRICYWADQFETQIRMGGYAYMQEIGNSGVDQFRMSFKVYKLGGINIGAAFQRTYTTSFPSDLASYEWTNGGEVGASLGYNYKIMVKMTWVRNNRTDFNQTRRIGECDAR